MAEVIEINQKRFFTLEAARGLLPVIRRVTEKSFQDIKRLSSQLNYVKDQARKGDLEKEVQQAFQNWTQKISKLGCEAKGMWLVDFDTGEGYFCWHYPEPHIEYFHGYFEGFRGRVRIH
jgi:hypothetical protein